MELNNKFEIDIRFESIVGVLNNPTKDVSEHQLTKDVLETVTLLKSRFSNREEEEEYIQQRFDEIRRKYNLNAF
jgi:hypothetical protein